jgi:hypothetical protein
MFSKPKDLKDPKYTGYSREDYLEKLNSKTKEKSSINNFRKKVGSNRIVIGEPLANTFLHLDGVTMKKVSSNRIVISEPLANTFLHLEGVTIY